MEGINDLIWYVGAVHVAIYSIVVAALLVIIMGEYAIDRAVRFWWSVKEFLAFVRHRLEKSETRYPS